MGQPMAHPKTSDRQPMAKPSAAQQKKGRLFIFPMFNKTQKKYIE
jgi:hypothetical protein